METFETVLKVTASGNDFWAARELLDDWLDVADDHIDHEAVVGLHISGRGGGMPVVATEFTDTEKMALSWAYFDKQFVVLTYEDMADNPKYSNGDVISGWANVTPADEAARHAYLREGMLSLNRFGLVEGYYEHGTPSKERIIETTKEGCFRVVDNGWRYKLTDAGQAALKQNSAFTYKCCDGCVKLSCVCREKTFCAEHGGGCHGSHD